MDITDKVLVEEFLKGDEKSFNIIVSRYQKKIYWHARRMLGNHEDADEITQEVLITLYKKLSTFKFDSALYTWIYKITSTRSLNLIKRKNIKRFFFSDPDELANNKSSLDIITDVENKERLEKVQQVLQKLPPKQREIFLLRNFEQLSYEEISKITGKSVGGLKANYFHALKKITGIMDYENE